jgi:V/A-type H+-transporting ATPase subunit D
MRLRPPPGRAGRIWLLRRLTVAHRGKDVLEQKRRALRHRIEQLEEQLEEARRGWEVEASEAETWWQRAAVLAGERPLELACASSSGTADVTITWRNTLGVVYPDSAEVAVRQDDLFPAGGSAALAYAAQAHGRALEAAAQLGAVQTAHRRASDELRATAQRVRAIERRWIPEHERALTALELALDEADREDAARARWVVVRRDGGRGVRSVAAGDARPPDAEGLRR